MVAVPSQFDSLDVGILVHDPQTGDILYANECAEELYGYSESELQKMTVGEFSSGSFSQPEAVDRIQAAAEGQSQRFEWRNKRSTGELYWVEVRLSDISIDDTTYVVAVVRDISEYKLTLRHLRVLTRITRHNLRNKLNVIDGFFKELDLNTTAENKDMIDRIQQNVSELLELTNWIDTVKSATRTEQATEPRDISKLVTEIGEKYRTEYPEITWHFECEECYAVANAGFENAIEELIDNAVRHNEHKGLKISVSLTKNPADDQVSIQITDTGQPIPEMEIDPIVGGYDPDPLRHGERIGLWEVQTIINAHGGRISINENSVEQKTIELVLPTNRGE